jgi:N utilization substance protein B
VSSQGESDETLAGGRHRAREVALQVLFAIDLGSRESSEGKGDVDPAGEEATPDSLADRSFEGVVEHFDVPRRAAAFARELVGAVSACRAELDELIGAHSRNWRVSRMAAVDRNVLRMAVYELRHTDTPVPVVIDEAVDLARRFGNDASPAFVNGVLDAVAREVRAA